MGLRRTQDRYVAARAIRDGTSLIMSSKLGQINVGDNQERIKHIVELARYPDLKPVLVAIDTGSVNIDRFDAVAKTFLSAEKIYQNSHETLMLLCEEFARLSMQPVISAWNRPFLRSGAALMDIGLIPGPAYALLVHCEGGIFGGHQVTTAGLSAFLSHFPEDRRTRSCNPGRGAIDLGPLMAVTKPHM